MNMKQIFIKRVAVLTLAMLGLGLVTGVGTVTVLGQEQTTETHNETVVEEEPEPPVLPLDRAELPADGPHRGTVDGAVEHHLVAPRRQLDQGARHTAGALVSADHVGPDRGGRLG